MIDSWHSYPKVYALGHAAIRDLLLDPVVIEEKIDGSQFSFGRFDGQLKVRSRGQEMDPDTPEKMFATAVKVVRDLPLHEGWTYRAEYLQKPKHNTLAYSRAPENHLIVFDVNTGQEEYVLPETKAQIAKVLGLEVVPVLATAMPSMEALNELLERESILGGCKIEGVVIKNYTRFGADGKALMGKFVSEAFKEKHGADWKNRNPTGRDIFELLADEYRAEARWEKAVQHLRERGELAEEPKDIGPLMKEVALDVLTECREEIQERLFQAWWKKVGSRTVTKGLPEWYKKRLAQEQWTDLEHSVKVEVVKK